MLDIIITKFGENVAISKKIGESSSIRSFISSLVCCRDQFSVQVLNNALKTFDNLEVRDNDAQNFQEYHSGHWNQDEFNEVKQELERLKTLQSSK